MLKKVALSTNSNFSSDSSEQLEKELSDVLNSLDEARTLKAKNLLDISAIMENTANILEASSADIRVALSSGSILQITDSIQQLVKDDEAIKILQKEVSRLNILIIDLNEKKNEIKEKLMRSSFADVLRENNQVPPAQQYKAQPIARHTTTSKVTKLLSTPTSSKTLNTNPLTTTANDTSFEQSEAVSKKAKVNVTSVDSKVVDEKVEVPNIEITAPEYDWSTDMPPDIAKLSSLLFSERSSTPNQAETAEFLVIEPNDGFDLNAFTQGLGFDIPTQLDNPGQAPAETPFPLSTQSFDDMWDAAIGNNDSNLPGFNQ